MNTVAVAALLTLQLQFAAMAPPRTDLEVVNGETSGYIEVVVNGKEVVKTFEKSVTDNGGKTRRTKVSTTWQAGPNQIITVTRRNWSTSDQTLTVYLRYYDEHGALIGISTPRQFAVAASGGRANRWVFTRADLAR